jgi:hypothetical protein
LAGRLSSAVRQPYELRLSGKEAILTEAFSMPRNRIRTLVLLAVSGLSAIAAAIAGITNNPPGILLAYLAATALVLAFVHPWRTPSQFRRLLYASALGLVLFGLLHNAFEAIAWNSGGSGIVPHLLDGAGAAFFLIATLVCPPGLLIGTVGSVVMYVTNHRRPTAGPTKAA